jgi:hypothetical protein
MEGISTVTGIDECRARDVTDEWQEEIMKFRTHVEPPEAMS